MNLGLTIYVLFWGGIGDLILIIFALIGKWGFEKEGVKGEVYEFLKLFIEIGTVVLFAILFCLAYCVLVR